MHVLLVHLSWSNFQSGCRFSWSLSKTKLHFFLRKKSRSIVLEKIKGISFLVHLYFLYTGQTIREYRLGRFWQKYWLAFLLVRLLPLPNITGYFGNYSVFLHSLITATMKFFGSSIFITEDTSWNVKIYVCILKTMFYLWHRRKKNCVMNYG